MLNDPKKVRELKTESGMSLGYILESEAQRLKDLIKYEMSMTISKYQPQGWYERTGNFERSLNNTIKIDPTNNSIIIDFDHTLAYHDSYFTKFNPSYKNKMFTPLAINEGYKLLFSKKRYPATHYIELAIEKFNQSKYPGITVKLQKTYNGNTYFDEYL